MKRLEQRILEVLDQVSGKIGEVLEVERELSRVRETIERLEGRIASSGPGFHDHGEALRPGG